MRQKLLDLLEKVRKIEKTSREAAVKSHHAANEASGGLVASYSLAGDVEHARNSANLSIGKAEKIKNLMEEIESSIRNGVPETTKPVCFLSIKYEGGDKKDLYLVENPVLVAGFNLISSNSPLGKSLLGKAVGDSFSYIFGEQSFGGKILEIG